MTTKMKLSDIHVTPDLQTRGEKNDRATVARYAERMKAGAVFPPLVLYRLTDRKFQHPALAAGFHRYEAYQEAGITEVDVEVRTGTFREAWSAGYDSNDGHGLPYTPQQKKHAIRKALVLFREESAAKIAERLHVHQTYVSKIRKLMVEAGHLDPDQKIVTSDGKTRSSSSTSGERKGRSRNAQTDNSQTKQIKTEAYSEPSGPASPPPPKCADPTDHPKRGRRKRPKPDDAERLVTVLKRNPDRTDEDIARGTRTDPELVAEVRKTLERKGEIPRPPKRFNPVEEGRLIRDWLYSRWVTWPEFCRHTFHAFVTRIVQEMEFPEAVGGEPAAPAPADTEGVEAVTVGQSEEVAR